MVEVPRLKPQGTSRISVGQDIPSLRGENSQLRSVRNIPTVSLSGLDSAARALNLSVQTVDLARQAFNETADNMLEEVRVNQQMEAERKYSETMHKVQLRFENLKNVVDPESDDFTKHALDDYDEYVEEILQDEKLSSYQKKFLQNKYTAQRTNLGMQAVNYQLAVEKANAEFDYQKFFESQQNRLLTNPEQFEDIMAETNAYIDAIELPELSKTKFREEMQEGFAAASVSAVVRKNPARAKAMIDSDRFNELLDPRSKEALIKDIDIENRRRQAEAEKAANAKKAATYAETRVAVSRGDMTHKQLDDMRKAEALDDAQWASLTIGLDSALKQKEEETAGIIDVANTLASGGGLSDDQAKDWDKYYRGVVLPQAAQITDPDAQASFLANQVASSGILPKSLENDITARIRSGSAADKADAIDTLKRIEEQNPLVKSSLPSNIRAYADRVGEIIEVNPDPTEAIKQVDMEFTNPAIAEARQKEFNKGFDFNKAQNKAANAFKGWFETSASVPVSTGTTIALQNDMKTLAGKYYTHNPDEDKALEYAAKEIKKTWGETSIAGGGKRLMKYAPEAVLPSYGGHKWVKQQLKADIPNIDLDNVFLNADGLTARTVESGRPAYQVMIKREDGVLDMLRDKNGVIQRFVPDSQKAAQEFKKKRLDKAQEDRAAAKRGREALGNLGVGPFTGSEDAI